MLGLIERYNNVVMKANFSIQNEEDVTNVADLLLKTIKMCVELRDVDL